MNFRGVLREGNSQGFEDIIRIWSVDPTVIRGGNGRRVAVMAVKAKVVVEVHLDHDLGLDYP